MGRPIPVCQAAQFPLRRIEKGKDTSKLRSWEQQSEAADSAPKRIKAEADSGPLNMSALLEAAVVSVGSVTPVQDYKTLCDSKTADNLGSATKQLQKLVNDAMMLCVAARRPSLLLAVPAVARLLLLSYRWRRSSS